MRNRIALIVTLIALTTACSGSSDAASNFCTQLLDLDHALTAAETAPDQIADLVENLHDIDPPTEIASAYNNIIDVYSAVADDKPLTDPDLATDLANVSDDINKVDNYLTEHCQADPAN